MHHYRIIYIKRDIREVWIETPVKTEEEAEEVFIKNFERYDDESDDASVDIDPLEIVDVTEIDEFGEEIDGN